MIWFRALLIAIAALSAGLAVSERPGAVDRPDRPKKDFFEYELLAVTCHTGECYIHRGGPWTHEGPCLRMLEARRLSARDLGADFFGKCSPTQPDVSGNI